MRRSTDHILTTHGGNLPRPDDLNALLAQADENQEAIQQRLPLAVSEVVDKQIECGVDIINDGEYVKAANMGSYTSYIAARVQGLEALPRDPDAQPKRAGPGERDRLDFPGFYESGLWFAGAGGPVRPGFMTPGKKPQPNPNEKVCTGPLKYVGQEAIGKDIKALKKGIEGKSNVDGFIAALGPLSTGAGGRNAHYRDERDYMMAIAETMREEYKAITDAGLIVQLDEPEFATTWMFYPDWSVEDYRKHLEFAVEVINHSIEGLPEEQIRFHMCWGSGHRPHVHDIEFRHIVDLMLKINAQCYTFEASNPRHAHEYHVFEDVKLPDGKIICPGVVGHYTDLVEHPELVAERLVNYGKIVGMENLQGGTDCGIGSRVGHEEIVWAKLSAMAEGAAIASARLKGK
ncbi:cobalamin-independent methionine synthase II family protein [Parasphingorhabdus sp.]|uniref:cobalamin-independent methionine synthase II family protein n=1 Tax=Parasphingorhabdus sp. TaxID=2709688 RepID=UPI003A90666A